MALATGKLPRPRLGEVSDTQALEQVRAVALAGKAHVCRHRQVREQAIVLGQVTDATSLGWQTDVRGGVQPDIAAKRDPSLARALQAGDRPQQGGLAGARWPDQRDRLTADAQRRAKVKRAPSEDDIDVEEVHECASSLAVSRIAALTIISSTPIAIAWSMLTSNSE